MLRDTRSRTRSPQTYYSHPQKQANAREPTDQNGRYGSVEMSHRDRRGNTEPDNPPCERAAAILGREPMQLGDCTNRDRNPEDAADDRPSKEPGFPRRVAKDGADDGARARESPSSEERCHQLQGLAMLPKVVPARTQHCVSVRRAAPVSFTRMLGGAALDVLTSRSEPSIRHLCSCRPRPSAPTARSCFRRGPRSTQTCRSRAIRVLG
jgi:hypothetical protein